MDKITKRVFYHFWWIAIIIFSQNNLSAQSSGDLVLTWDTRLGASPSESFIIIPTRGSGYNYDVDWNNDGVFDEMNITGNITHDFGTPGIYTIRIRGDFPEIYNFQDPNNAKKLISVDQWGNIHWRSLFRAFYGCHNLHINATDAPDLSNVIVMDETFSQCHVMNDYINHWDVSNVRSFSYTFNDCYTFNQPLDHWDVSNAYRIRGMFDSCLVFDQPIGNWNVSNVTDMKFVFYNAQNFNQPLANWNTSQVTDMRGMFALANSFNQPIGNWDTHNVTDMQYMFYYATHFNQPIGNWNTGNVTNMQHMFDHATAFNQPIGNWDTHNVTDLQYMFYYATDFNQPIGNWDTGNVTNMIFMFDHATAFNQPIGNWNTGNVTNMGYMFYSASSFDQDLSAWNLQNLFYASRMFDWSGLSVQNYDAFLISWQAQPHQIHSTGSNYFSARGIHYCRAEMARAALIADGWDIIDAGRVQIEVDSLPDADVCDYYVLPAIQHGQYIILDNGNYRQLQAGDTISQSGTVYILATDGYCADTTSFHVTVTPTPQVDTLPDADACDSYTLPALQHGNYYTQSGGQGQQLHAGDVLTSSQRVYIYARNDSPTGNHYCEAETYFDVTITPTPQVDSLPDVEAVNFYVLPQISNGDFYTEPQGQGNLLFPGDTIYESQTIYIYAINGHCWDETSFEVNIRYELTYSPYFTPNGDGIQDTWGIYNYKLLNENCIIYIFDKYGRNVARIRGNVEGWDGKYQNRDLPADDYWFKVKLTTGEVARGHFALIR